MYLDKLIKFKLFSSFSLEELTYYKNENLIVFKEYKKGHILHGECEPCLNLDVVISGKLSCYDLSEDGDALTMFDFFESNVIGANLLFSNRTCYPLNIHCKSDSVVAHINKTTVLKFLTDNENFMLEFIKILSNNSLNMNKKMITFARKNLRQGIIDFLKTQSLKQNSNVIVLPITKKQLADELGVQRPSLFRELKKMKDEHIIDYNAKKIVILRMDLF